MSETNATSIRIKNAYNSGAKSWDVNLQDQHTEPKSLFLSNQLSTSNLTSALSIGDQTITLGDSGTTAGRYIELIQDGTTSNSGRQSQFKIVSASSRDYTLDNPIDYAYSTSAKVKICNIHMNVDGSTTKSTYYICTPSYTTYDITRMTVTIYDDAAMDDGKFGGINTLTNGVVFLKHNDSAETYNLFNIARNGDLRIEGFDIDYTSRAPAGENSVGGVRTFAGQGNSGVAIRLSKTTASTQCLKVIIQDNLSALSEFIVKAQGHVLD